MAQIKTLAEAQKETIEAAIVEMGGNLRATAHAVGCSRATLYRMLRRHGISVSEVLDRPRVEPQPQERETAE